MAKGDKVRKGFFFYVMMLLLFIIAIFFILVVVMVFNPGMSILGLKYFSTATTKTVDTYSILDTPFNFDFTERVDIYVSGDNINFEMECDQTIENPTILIENYQTGFAKSEQSTNFDCNIKYELGIFSASRLYINVTNPEGFLYFNSNCYVKILIPKDPATSTAKFNSENSVNVSCGTGSINLGTITEEQIRLDINNLNLSTTSGTIRFGKNLDNSYNSIIINNESGSVISYQDEMYFANNSVLSLSGNGQFEFNKLIPNANASFSIQNNIERGSLKANEINANMSLKTISGNFEIKTYTGNLESNSLVNETNGMNLTIDKASGAISLPFANNSNIKIADAENCNLFINSNNATIQIDKLGATSWVEAESGSIDVSLSSSSKNVNVISETATINATGVSNMNAVINLTSITGKINFNYYQTSTFTAEFYNSKGEARENVSVEGYDTIENPLYVNGGGNKMTITTDGEISLKFA